MRTLGEQSCPLAADKFAVTINQKAAIRDRGKFGPCKSEAWAKGPTLKRGFRGTQFPGPKGAMSNRFKNQGNILILPDEKEGLKIFSEIIRNFSQEERDDFFEAMKKIRGQDLSFSYENIEVYNDYVIVEQDGKKYGIVTEHAYLEMERIRKNDILKSSIGQTVKVVGVVGDVKMFANTALFCLSPCIINKTDIGHTWTRYSPSFKNIKYNSTICFYSELKTYGNLNSKSGVDWQEISYIRMKGGDNSCFYNLPVDIKAVAYSKEWLKHNEPEGKVLDAYKKEINKKTLTLRYAPASQKRDFSLRRFRFYDVDGIKIAYDTYNRELVLNSKFAILINKEQQNKIDNLLFFEWMAKLEDWEFWGYVKASK